MNVNSILMHIYSIMHQGIKIWSQGSNIKLFVPKNAVLKEEHTDFIKLNRKQILKHLVSNCIYTKDYDILILKEQSVQPLLSFSQERLWFMDQYEGGSNAYNIEMTYKLSPVIRLDVLEQSIRHIVLRHEILRTLIKKDNEGNSYQLVFDSQQNPIEIIKKTLFGGKNELVLELAREASYKFNLSETYPIRILFYQLKENNKEQIKSYLHIIVHHIAFDGWSADIFLHELTVLYDYYFYKLQGKEVSLNLPEITIQYKDFALWQRSYLSGERLEEGLNYWKNKLIDCETLYIPTDKTRFKQIDYKGSDIYFEIEESISIALRELAKELKVSLFSVLLAGYYIMLKVYSSQNDIVIGTPVANRHYNQVDHLIGFFVNTLALRVQIDDTLLVKDFIKQVGREVIAAQLHQDVPFEKLVEELKVPRDTSRHPIFQIMFGMERFGKRFNNTNSLWQEYVSQVSQKHTYKVAKFEISTFIDDSTTILTGSFNYAISLYEESSIKRLLNTYLKVLTQLAALVSQKNILNQVKVSDLNYLDDIEYDQVVKQWNVTDKEFPEDKTIQTLFEEQVERVPENIAVICAERKLTYRELNEKANRLAHYLIQYYEITPDSLVALCLERNEYILIAILAVLKAGGAYVPIDPSYPDDRIEYILTDTATKVVLGNEIYNQRLTHLTDCKLHRKVIYLSIDSIEFQYNHLSTQSKVNPITSTTSDNLAYIIYTSGTTGKPKGVMLAHKGVVNTVLALSHIYNFDKGNKVAAFTSYVFDVSVSEFFTVLFRSGVLHLLHEQIRSNAFLISRYIIDNNINYLYLPPALLSMLPKMKYEALYGIIYAGEPCDPNTGKFWSNNYRLYNYYGPTETTIYACGKQVINGDINLIGSPLPNTQCYVLDHSLRPLPIGAIGELHIGGAGLAKGYLNKPELTKEKFITNPFQGDAEKTFDKNNKLYKTGDLVRWLPDGNLEYIGRNDFQVKIRGYRIELGEIEHVLSNYQDIKQSIILVKEHENQSGSIMGSKYLVAYYVSDNKLDQESIMSYLQYRLPEYMIPTMFVHLEKFPLTIHGKLDSKALPDPAFTDSKKYVAPRNEVEEKLSEIWAEVLGLPKEKVGITDDFFRLGGDSIISIQLVSKVRQRLGLNLSIKNIFTYRNIEKLYDNVLIKVLGDNSRKVSIKAEQQILSGKVPLLPIQEWFFLSNLTKYNHWNQSFIVNTPSLDIARLSNSLKKLIRHHDAFRLKYNLDYYQRNTAREDVQYYDHTAPVESLKLLDIKSLGEEETSKAFKEKLQNKLTEWQSNFDLEKGPLYSIGYLYGYRDGSARIHFGLHHLLVDTVSWRILVEDLSAIYHGKALGIKGSSYRQWVETVKEDASHDISEKHYWAHVLLDCAINSALGKLAVEEVATNDAEVSLSRDATQALLQESSKAYNTQINDILLTALGYTLAALTGNKVNHITLEGHGREEIDPSIEVTRTVGWFTTMYPVRLAISDDIGESIKHIKETLRQIPNNGVRYGVLMGYEKENILPKVSFNYLGQFNQQSTASERATNWHITDEDSGASIHVANKDYHILNINGLVIDGQLQFTISSRLNATITSKVAHTFQRKLKEIINICSSSTTYTISDFSDFEPYVLIKGAKNETNPKLFLFPSGGVGAESYFNNLVPKLTNRDLVLFNNYFSHLAQAFGDNYVSDITYEMLAKEHINYIKFNQPKGPYTLLGWSFGAMLSFELANQLIIKGDEVKNLILIDPFFNFKEALRKSMSKLSIVHNINVNYFPSLDPKMFDINIILFKALKPPHPSFLEINRENKEVGELYKIYSYYATETIANNIEYLIKLEKIKIIPMNHDHSSWVKDNNQVTEICDNILACS